GPGTLEITRLNGGGANCARPPGAIDNMSGPVISALIALACTWFRPENRRLPVCIDSWIAASRSAGSDTLVARLQRIDPTALPESSPESSRRREIGVIAIS